MAVTGLNTFREYFREYLDQYVLIGGSACSILLNAAGLSPRTTKDLDLVFVASLSSSFYRRVWDFLREGNYQPGEIHRKEKAVYYRFVKPGNPLFPAQIEILSKATIPVLDGQTTAPIAINGQPVSLSAILLDEDYYELIMHHRVEIDSISLAPAKVLIPLKAKAWMNLSETEATHPGSIRSTDIRKHIEDIFLLQEILVAQDPVDLSETIQADLRKALALLSGDPVRMRHARYAEKLEMLGKFFQL